MATSKRNRVSYWQQGVDDARSGFRPDLACVALTSDTWSNTIARTGYSNGYRFGMANPTPTTKNKSPK